MRGKRPIIAVDIDDVLTQGVESFRRQINEQYGLDLQPEHYAVPGEYTGYFERVWQAQGVAEKVRMADLLPQMAVSQAHVAAAPGAIKVLRELSKRYDIIVVSSRYQDWEPETHRWINRHYPGVFVGVYFAGRHGEAKNKGDVCQELGVNWLIDDNPDHAKTALDKGIKVVLFGDYGWHKTGKVPAGIVRVKDWAVVLAYFDKQDVPA